MAWGSISLFAGFLEKENSLEALIVIFKNVSPKGFFLTNMKDFEISVLTANSRYLQTAALKWQALERFALLATHFISRLWRSLNMDLEVSDNA